MAGVDALNAARAVGAPGGSFQDLAPTLQAITAALKAIGSVQ